MGTWVNKKVVREAGSTDTSMVGEIYKDSECDVDSQVNEIGFSRELRSEEPWLNLSRGEE